MLWIGPLSELQSTPEAIQATLARVRRPVFAVDQKGATMFTNSGYITNVADGVATLADDGLPLLGVAPALGPQELGDESFKKDHGLTYAYIMGAMANGISSVNMVRAAGKAGMLGFFGAGGLSLDQIEMAIASLQGNNEAFPVGFNLIHSPSDQALEAATVDLYLRRGVSLISASAFLGLTPALVRYRVQGIYQTPQGEIVCPNRIIAKVSREEVARKFFGPPPEPLLNELVRDGHISTAQAQLAGQIPMAQDMTAEADSGGHTDNRPALSLFPTMVTLRDQAVQRFGYTIPLRVGLGGGIATPSAAAAAFAMGAAFILTGSINQACLEADTSTAVRRMLVDAQQADVVMAPAADMFELGAKVQVLKRGTMFAMRAVKLYDLYRRYNHYGEIDEKDRRWIEQELLKTSFDEAWEQTCHYFNRCNPTQIDKALKDPHYQMALVFRSYLGQASLWAKTGVPDRQIDYQIWCGPAMGAFNAWVKDSFLESMDQRRVTLVAMNLLFGACVLTRTQWLRHQGVSLNRITAGAQPMTEAQLDAWLGS